MQSYIKLGIFGFILSAQACMIDGQNTKSPDNDALKQTKLLDDNNSREKSSEKEHENTQAQLSDFEKAFSKRFSGFKTVPAGVLEKVVEKIPEQGDTRWSCGLHQSETAIEVAHINHQHQRKGDRNFRIVDDYPLAVDVNIKHKAMTPIVRLANLIGQTIPSDEEGNFRVGALPHDLADYIDSHLPKSYPYEAQAISQASLSSDDLLELVDGNLKLGMPTPAFSVVNPNSFLIHVYSIVGFKDDDLLVLETDGKGIERLQVKKTAAFLASMNAGAIIQEIQKIIVFGETLKLREIIKSVNGKAASEESFELWKAYSLIKFKKA